MKYKLRSYIFNKIEYFLSNKQTLTIKLNFDSSICTIMQNKTTDEYCLISSCSLKLLKWMSKTMRDKSHFVLCTGGMSDGKTRKYSFPLYYVRSSYARYVRLSHTCTPADVFQNTFLKFIQLISRKASIRYDENE